MHLINLKTMDVDHLNAVIDAAIEMKQHPEQYADCLKGRSLYMLFEKTSTRTALGFGLGFEELGGRTFFQKWDDSNFVVGDIEDEVRFVARNVDIILARLKLHKDFLRMADASPVPVINGCCEKYHPTQALADCMTVKERFCTYEKTVVYIGIWNNVFNSLAASFPRLGGRLIGVCPIINPMTLSEGDAEKMAGSTENLTLYRTLSFEQLKAIVDDADIVYTDTWVDMEFINNPEYEPLKKERIRRMGPYGITPELLKDSRAMVMHDMPIHPGYEIDRTVVEKHMDTILDQGENRRHTAKSLCAFLLGAN